MPRIELQVDKAPGQIVLAFECDAAQRSGGNRTTFGPVLMLPLQFMEHFPPQNRAEPLLVSGVLRWYRDNEGIPIPTQPWLFNQTILSIALSDGQIERIEQQRAGGQAMFEFALRGLALVDGTATVVSAMNFVLLVVSRDEWVRILAAMGHGLRRLVELPPPPNGIGGLWDMAAERIKAGSARLAAGDPGVALAEARNATERLLEAIGESIGRPRNGGLKPFAEGIAKSLRARHVDLSDDPYAVLAKAVELAVEVFGFASQPGHAGFDGSGRRDAELALGLATTLYGYAARLPNVPSARGDVVPEAGA